MSANGTVALELALYALGIGPGDEVITTARTFIASASCIVMRGATPVIADLEVTKAASGTVSGQVNLTQTQVDSLKAGKLYVQIHSQAGPDGHLWGFLLP